MGNKKSTTQKDKKPRLSKAKTKEGLESQLEALALDAAFESFKEGKASSQLITFLLKRSEEKKKLEMESKLTDAKVNKLESEKKMEELYEKAIEAFSKYNND